MSENTQNTIRNLYIDFIKVIAILGVVILHNDTILYHSRYISTLARFALPLFLLVGGYNIYQSFSRKEKIKLDKQLLKLLVPYVFATIISCSVLQKEFNAANILYALINFTATYPLYYVILHIELLIFSIFLTRLIQHGCTIKSNLKKFIYFLLFSILICITCFLTTKYSTMFQWKFWSNMLLGGPMLLLWFSGMLFASFSLQKKQNKINYLLIILSSIGISFFVILTFSGKIHNIPNLYGYTGNVFTLPDIIYVFSIFGLITGISSFLQIKKDTVFYKLITYIGKRTYYIFLYHILFQVITAYWITYPNIWIKRIVVFSSMIVGPLLIEFVFAKLKTLISEKKM